MKKEAFEIEPIAYGLEPAAHAIGETRTGIFEAIREGKLIARKRGRRTIIEREELVRYVKSLPVAGAA